MRVCVCVCVRACVRVCVMENKSGMSQTFEDPRARLRGKGGGDSKREHNGYSGEANKTKNGTKYWRSHPTKPTRNRSARVMWGKHGTKRYVRVCVCVRSRQCGYVRCHWFLNRGFGSWLKKKKERERERERERDRDRERQRDRERETETRESRKSNIGCSDKSRAGGGG